MHEKTRRAVLGTGIAAAGSGLLAACGSPGPRPRAGGPDGTDGTDGNAMGAPARPGAPADDTPAQYVSPTARRSPRPSGGGAPVRCAPSGSPPPRPPWTSAPAR
ncbi:hypothetical protein SVIO_036880 [Streptomyces violaceusniger]|uniref:Lipoprotein n=1 Tax=Streptomyces violaceusniger TaxID=68280 RepID=A0A4D4KVS8_STRVO|nr:hypothetical protein SVIO_036880 [Streptomyces violaceusniger]